MAMWITCRNYNHYLDKLSFIEKDGMKGNLPFSSVTYQFIMEEKTDLWYNK